MFFPHLHVNCQTSFLNKGTGNSKGEGSYKTYNFQRDWGGGGVRVNPEKNSATRGLDVKDMKRHWNVYVDIITGGEISSSKDLFPGFYGGERVRRIISA